MRNLTRRIARRLKAIVFGDRRDRTRPPVFVEAERAPDAAYRMGPVVFTVPVDRCLYPYGYSFGPKGWHPFVATLRAYARDRSLTYERSPLQAFYERFQPASVLELLYPPEVVSRRRGSPLGSFPLSEFEAFLPWHGKPAPRRSETELPAHYGHQGYGPVSPEKGELEFERLRATFESIERRGYRPREIAGGDITGYFLTDADRFRFIIRAGQHRMAALAALGHERVQVAFTADHCRLVDVRTVSLWPLVRNGPYDRELAELLVDMFLNDAPPWVADAHGFLPGRGATPRDRPGDRAAR